MEDDNSQQVDSTNKSIDDSNQKSSTEYDQKLSPFLNKKVFENRRKMAWVSLFSILIFTGILLFTVPSDRINNYSDIIYYFYFTCASVVLGYMGSTSVSLIGNVFNKKK